ncbi:metallophosphoesterase [Candidatus Bathyarchaeota archaeon]|nr:metallophosphoesterase [Candidatus Bathyarchaeota archaeon]
MEEAYTIAHLSDIHVGEKGFRRDQVLKCIAEVNVLTPNLTLITGDLTWRGLYKEFEEARELIDGFEQKPLVIMGNHDAYNLGYNTFEKLFGERMIQYEDDQIFLVGVDSTQPDIDAGHIGRVFQDHLHEVLLKAPKEKIRLFSLHHHLAPVPNSGRERDILTDAGDVLSMLIEDNVKITFCGHRHVSWTWHVESMLIIHAGTVGSPRLRGMPDQSYLIIRIKNEEASIYLKFIGKKEKLIRKFKLD